jgi:L-alanine-DL-glutamate epimerase-like enolase superfamily enzyme
VGFSRAPQTLKRNLVTNASIFEDFESREEGWFGPTFCTLVEIETSDGVVGVGTAGGFSGAAKSIVEDYLADLVIGEDIRDHERLWQRMYRTTVRFGRRGPAVSALSAIDIAAWDAHGISEGKSVVELLGGRTRVSAPIYISRLYALEDLDELAAEAKGYVAQGVTRMKQRFGFGPQDGPLGMQRNTALVRAVREAVGENIELAADAYMGWDFGYTIEMAKRLREFGLSWIEEPLMPEQVDRYAELRLRLPWQRWSCGEHSYTKWDFAELIRLRATDILQPDLNRTGGLTEGRKIAALAETAGLPLVPHSNEAHNLALVFSQSPNVCPVVEYFPNVEPDTGNELFWKLFDGNSVANDGSLEFPTNRPGLGISVREDVVESLVTADGGWHVA